MKAREGTHSALHCNKKNCSAKVDAGAESSRNESTIEDKRPRKSGVVEASIFYVFFRNFCFREMEFNMLSWN